MSPTKRLLKLNYVIRNAQKRCSLNDTLPMDGADFFGYVMVVYVVMKIGCRESSFLIQFIQLFNEFIGKEKSN